MGTSTAIARVVSLENNSLSRTMTPREIVGELDKYIIGQSEAKRAVAIALRNRWRRMQVNIELRKEITPKNILMIGQKGVGKTEIARRLAGLADAPFIKVEATKFTEVGYVGRDVESIIRDLMDVSIKMIRESEMFKVRSRAEESAEERILDVIVPKARGALDEESASSEKKEKEDRKSARQLFRKKLREGELGDKEIEIDLSSTRIGVEIMAPPGMEEMTSQLQNMFQSLTSDKKKTRKLKIKDALKVLVEEEAAKMLNEDDIRSRALETVEQNGIVFLDEIDKIVKRSEYSSGADISREGVQRDLLPLVEGCTVFTKYGMVRTDHVLFIASGAFHLAKPSDLVPELQGRLPIRVELKALTADDFAQILTDPKASLTQQYQALLATEGVNLQFTQSGIRRIAEIAFRVNETTENIGARRLHTIMERLVETVSFEASDRSGETIKVDKAYVNKQLEKLVDDEDLSRYIL